MDPGIVGHKASIRAWAKSQPRCSPAEAGEVVKHLAEWLDGMEPLDVLGYLAMPGEITLDGLAAEAGQRHRFHVTRTPRSGPLTVHMWKEPFEDHPFGFRQPPPTAVEVDPMVIDVVLAPGLAFDHGGGRLGYGRGYYDELLVRTKRVRAIVGVTLERFLVEQVPTERHDRAMTHIATERGVTAVFR